MRLKRSFYQKPAEEVAKNLLGKYIVRKIQGKEVAGKIIETEAYIGGKDRASHAYCGKKTERNKAEYLTGGHIYIYLVYGMYWQLNITTGKKDEPECVLIRAIDTNDDIRLTNGPGKLCNYLKLNKSFYTEDLTKSKRIWLEKRENKKPNILATGRVGIEYAGTYWSRRKLRFLIKDYKRMLSK